jgi:tripartite ATP-independent transporter DctM subunit
MTIGLLTVLLLLCVLLVFAAGTPVGFGLGSIAMAFAAFTWGPQAFKLIPTTALNAMSSFLLLAIPLFIFMGQILVRSGLGEAMFHAAHVAAGRIRGGLAIGVIIVCSLIGAMVGIIGAGIMTAGSIALKPMFEKGYNRHLALGAVMAGGGLGILIPPSIPMIIFSAVTKSSIGKMFAGGLVPAAIMIFLFIVYIGTICWLKPEMGPALTAEERGTRRDKIIAVRDGGLAFGLICLVLGSILFGIATPTESAAIGGLGAIAMALGYRRLKFSVLKEASIKTMSLTAIALWIIIGATVFTNFHMMMGAGRLLTTFTDTSGLPPWAIIVAMQLSMLIMGCIIDEFIIVIICAPLYTPIAVSLGYDPIWFGIVMILNMEIAIQTPPYGFALFYLKSVAPPDVTMLDIYRSIAPFLVIKLIVLTLCIVFPDLVTWLPNLLFD